MGEPRITDKKFAKYCIADAEKAIDIAIQHLDRLLVNMQPYRDSYVEDVGTVEKITLELIQKKAQVNNLRSIVPQGK